MSQPRVLVVEDEASIRRFVEMALEDEPIELVLAASLAEAHLALATAPAQLVIGDLMLGDGSGYTLFESLTGVTGTRCVAFSAGIAADARARLAAIGVHEVLSKPVSVAALQQCVALTLAAANEPREGARGEAAAPAVAAVASATAAEQGLADEYFGGDVELLRVYRVQCLRQFARDVVEGDRAAERADVPALRRLAHGVKSVLRMLGEVDAAAVARHVEDLGAAGEPGPTLSAWPNLRERLQGLAAQVAAEG